MIPLQSLRAGGDRGTMCWLHLVVVRRESSELQARAGPDSGVALSDPL